MTESSTARRWPFALQSLTEQIASGSGQLYDWLHLHWGAHFSTFLPGSTAGYAERRSLVLKSDAGHAGKSRCVCVRVHVPFCVFYHPSLPLSLAETYPSKFDSTGADSHAAEFWSFKCSEACLNSRGVKKKKKKRQRREETTIESNPSHALVSHEGLPATFLWKIMLTCQSSKS